MKLALNRLSAMASLALLVGAGSAAAQDGMNGGVDGLPSAQEIIADYVEALGGEEAITSHQTMHATGTVEDMTKGRTGALDYRIGTGQRMFMKVEFPDETLAAGCTGDVAWRVHPAVGPIIFGAPDERNAFNFDMHRAANYDKHFQSMQTIGRVVFDGRPCYKLRIFDNIDRGFHEYFDVETGLKAGVEKITEYEKGDMTSAEILRDYKEFDGVMVPTRAFTRLTGQGKQNELIQIVTYEEVSFDTLSDEDFEMPDAVKQAAERQLGEAGGEEEPKQNDSDGS